MAIAFLASSFLLRSVDVALAQTAHSTESRVMGSEIINVNKATAEDLQKVKGIGPVLAERVITYREANGQFKSLDQLREVKGIGQAKFEKIKSQITL